MSRRYFWGKSVGFNTNLDRGESVWSSQPEMAVRTIWRMKGSVFQSTHVESIADKVVDLPSPLPAAVQRMTRVQVSGRLLFTHWASIADGVLPMNGCIYWKDTMDEFDQVGSFGEMFPEVL